MNLTRDILDDLVQPFWLSNCMVNETVLFLRDGAILPDAPLLFAPTKILSVRNSALDTTYAERQDWLFEEDRLKLLPGSRIFHMDMQALRPQIAPPDAGTMPGRDGRAGVLFAEGAYFHTRQTVITYSFDHQLWQGPRPSFQGDRLPCTLHLLQHKKKLKLVLYGDSISVGANSSKISGVPPFVPSWGELVKLTLENRFLAQVEYINSAEGGKSTDWGVAEVETRVANHSPDLVILAFGMNDGTAGLPPEAFQKNLATMMAIIRRANPETEYILVAPMLANPKSTFAGMQPAYGETIQAMSGVGAAAVDMGRFHAALLQRKRYVDLTGNNINHPNDFLARCYAMAVLSALVDWTIAI